MIHHQKQPIPILLFVSLLTILGHFGGISLFATTLPTTETISLRVGSICVSSYIYARERDRFSMAQENFDEAGWRAGWIDRLKVINRAIDRGWRQQPEVTNAIRIMSRFMIIYEPESPFNRLVIDPAITLPSDTLQPHSAREKRRLRNEHLEKLSRQIAEELDLRIDPTGAEHAIRWAASLPQSPDTSIESHDQTIFLYDYSHDQIRISVSLAGFKQLYREKILQHRISDTASLRSEITALLVHENLYQQALAQKLDEDRRFLLELENFTQKTIYNAYINRPFNQEPQHGDTEVKAHFISNHSSYRKPTIVTLRLFESGDPKILREIQSYLRMERERTGQPGHLLTMEKPRPGLVTYERTLTEGDPVIADGTERLYNLNPGWISPLRAAPGRFYFYVPLTVQPVTLADFAEVSDQVLADYRKYRVEERLRDEIEEIGSSYPFALF